MIDSPEPGNPTLYGRLPWEIKNAVRAAFSDFLLLRIRGRSSFVVFTTPGEGDAH